MNIKLFERDSKILSTLNSFKKLDDNDNINGYHFKFIDLLSILKVFF